VNTPALGAGLVYLTCMQTSLPQGSLGKHSLKEIYFIPVARFGIAFSFIIGFYMEALKPDGKHILITATVCYCHK
jgi:hypothetical protein